MGSPDPDGRQIGGLGGGLSSLSKCAIVGRPGEAFQYTQPASYSSSVSSSSSSGDDWPGHAFVEDVQRSQDGEKGWDVVYRFGQVPINDGTTIDWGSTCGNLVSAVAMVSHASSSSRLLTHLRFIN